MGKFTKDSLITFITQVLSLIFGLGTSIIVARVLGPEGKGIYALAILLPATLIMFCNFGIAQASVFYIGKRKYRPEEIFGNNIIFSFLLIIFTFLIGLIIVFFFANSLFPNVAKSYLLLALFLVPFNFFLSFVNYILLGLQKIKEFNFIKILQNFIFLILIALFLLGLNLGLKAVIVANILSCFFGTIVLFFLARKIVGIPSLHFNKAYFKDAFQYGIKVYLGNIVFFLHSSIAIFLINIFLNPLAVGFYSVAVGMSEKIWLVSQSVGTVLFPRVSSETDRKRLKEFTPIVCRNILFINSLGAILLFFLSRWLIILLYSERFLNSLLPFQILLIGAVTIGGYRILTNDLYGRGRPELNIYIGLIALSIHIILSIIWIPKYSILGAAWATSISYTFAFIVMTSIYSRISKNRINDIAFVKKSDLQLYKNLIRSLKEWKR